MDFYFYRMLTENIVFAVVIAISAIIVVSKGKLTNMGGLVGCAVAYSVYAGAGVVGLLMLGLFFVLGTLSTSFGKRVKDTIKIDDNNGGRRTAGQVIANGGVAAVCGIFALAFPQHSQLLIVMLAASLSSATADTLSSELGTIYGKRFYNILTFKKDIRGENGVVSLEGTMLGIGGSAVIAISYCLVYGWKYFLLIVVAGTIGNITDSILGAVLERKGYIKNNTVNLLNTIVAALTVSCFLLV